MLFVLSLVFIGGSKNGGKEIFLTSITFPYLTINKIVPLRVSVLDVGQGLSVVVETEGASGKRALVYDSGPGYEDGFNMADAVVIPYLRYRGQTALDMLIVSHGDNDHAGGAMNIVEALSPRQIILGEDISKGRFTFSSCKSGYTWQWDDVIFEFLHPKENIEKESNNRSCVLQISYGHQTVILPGDIESKVESQLQTHMQGYKVHHKDRTTLLVAPHHGSKTSSSPGFVSLLAPKHVVFSAGYKHHFGHPTESVLQRYKNVGSTLWTTADHGAVEFTWDQYGQLTVSSRRVDAKRYWH
jgi:competence protein ComEC